MASDSFSNKEDDRKAVQELEALGYELDDFQFTDESPGPPWIPCKMPVLMGLPDRYTLHDIEPKLAVYDQPDNECVYQYNQLNDFVSSFDKYKDVQLKIVFIVHGFQNSFKELWIAEMKNALFQEKEKKVVVAVDWEGGANLNTIKYRYAVTNVPVVGIWLGEAVYKLKQRFPAFKAHGVGHSLGAHILGTAGKASLNSFYRISGLDPAGPRFYKKTVESHRLCMTDAEVVDVIHTCAYEKGFLGSRMYLGLLPSLGTVDFYPNFGICPQPGTDGILESHSRAHDYFTWSILNPGKFTTHTILDGVPEVDEPVEQTKNTDNEAEMGYFCFKEGMQVVKGNYYLQTNKNEPWV